MWTLKRTHTCGELRGSHAGQSVTLNGWVDKHRDHGGLVFVDLRDRYGRTQVIFPSTVPQLRAKAAELGSEFVVAVRGVVRRRSPEALNAKMPTGEIEVEAAELEVLNAAKTPPFEVRDEINVSEELRLKYRYLDLRRPLIQKNFLTRSAMVQAIRESMTEQGFLDLETPSLVKFTPGGARNYLVPSRLTAGYFYALAESPQIFKQLFMVSGLDRYFQIARCWRDEDLRADRQSEFTQLDVEMSFVEPPDVMTAIEKCVKHVWKRVLNVEVATPFRRISYDESMRDYGVDKPDLRFGMKIVDVSESMKSSGFQVFSKTVAGGGVVRGLCVSGGGVRSRKEIEALETYVKGIGGKGLVWLKVEDGKLGGGSAKFLSEPEQKTLIGAFGAATGDLLLLVADEEEKAAGILGGLRNQLRDQMKLVRSDDFNFCWVVDFPMFEYSEESKAWVARHHPFTSPQDQDLELLERDPGKVKAKAYDLVLNGVELGGGSIRIHRRDIQARIFKALGFTEQYVQDRFGFLLEAFEYGAPPHGGIALGIDRMAMLMLGLENIRDVMSFPKTQKAQCLMTGAPTAVSDAQLKELHLRVVQD